ncbi:putative peptidase C40 family protein [Streptomyces sp. NBRC 110611]|uniref:C40 family peptidase n=1 Tax=Streptomyces sp. NBRC 110611 TaxID=1621259 RepID=UPI0008339B1E|nr:C40 family peptidase [Streptomyces sp. NBRC 110611]GAU68215.1 putative peptidase C40 family protein [Streptomyces sp. NBRC 110611]
MPSHRRTSQHGQAALAGVTVLSALATAAAALTAPPAAAAPADPPAAGREAAAARLDALYEQAERATERFNGVTARTEELRATVAVLQDRTARAQERLNRMRGRLGALAAAQYRSGGIDPLLRLMLSERPDSYLEKATALDRIGTAQAGGLRELRAAQRFLEQQRRETAAALTELAESRRLAARHKKDVLRRLGTARRLLNALPRDAREAYGRASRGDGRDPVIPDLSGAVPVSGRAATAVSAVRSAVGAPYAWGSSGPTAFDCSGLTQWAYAWAGISLPRTSQAQAGAGRQVPLSQVQPGDLVIYRSDASHVGMYVGNGQVVHAPHPGAQVRYDPVGMMPISAVTRP